MLAGAEVDGISSFLMTTCLDELLLLDFRGFDPAVVLLDELHQLTSEASFGLKIVLTDFGGKRYTAHYDRFRVRNIFHPFRAI